MAKGDYEHAGEDPCTGGESLQTWGANECGIDCQQSSTKHMVDALEQYSMVVMSCY